MVIATITSGLGNQLFQYALARHLSIRNRTSLYFDKRFYRSEYARESQRGFKLDHFSIPYKELNRPLEYLIKAAKTLPGQKLHPLCSVHEEKYYHFNPDVLKANDQLIVVKGYWHSEKYFKNVEAQIREELSFSNIPGEAFEGYRKEIASAATSVSVHIRRGDYVNHPEFSKTFGFLGLEYYDKAIEIVSAQHPGCKFFVFTDDPDWVSENLNIKEESVYVRNVGAEADIDDLHLMSLCKHNIIANSSYSWWGAWLNRYEHKQVIAPKNWFKNQPDWNTKDLLPATWLTV